MTSITNYLNNENTPFEIYNYSVIYINNIQKVLNDLLSKEGANVL